MAGERQRRGALRRGLFGLRRLGDALVPRWQTSQLLGEDDWSGCRLLSAWPSWELGGRSHSAVLIDHEFLMPGVPAPVSIGSAAWSPVEEE